MPSRQAVEQFCHEAQEAQGRLRDAEERLQSLATELMHRCGRGIVIGGRPPPKRPA